MDTKIISSLEGETLICDNGFWSSNGQHYRTHYKVTNGTPIYVGTQHYWTNQVGKFDTGDAGWESHFVVNESGFLCVGSERNCTKIKVN